MGELRIVYACGAFIYWSQVGAYMTENNICEILERGCPSHGLKCGLKEKVMKR